MRTFGASFITQKNAQYAKPLIVGWFTSPGSTIYVCDRARAGGVTISGRTYHPIVESWGQIGASLSGFADAFGVARTTVRLQNDKISGRRFSARIPRFNSQMRATIYFAFEDPASPGTYYLEVALRGPVTDSEYDLATAVVEVTSEAKIVMERDLLLVTDESWTGIPEGNVGRAIPLVAGGRFNDLDAGAADRVPAWLYGTDRSKLLLAEDIRPAVLNYTLGSRYWQGAEVVETETSAGITAPVP